MLTAYQKDLSPRA